MCFCWNHANVYIISHRCTACWNPKELVECVAESIRLCIIICCTEDCFCWIWVCFCWFQDHFVESRTVLLNLGLFSPQHFVFGSPFLLSLSAYTCNAGTHDFYPPLSTRPIVVIVVVPPQPVTLCISMDRVGMLKQEYTWICIGYGWICIDIHENVWF